MVVPFQPAHHPESLLKADSMEPTPRNSDVSGLAEAWNMHFYPAPVGILMQLIQGLQFEECQPVVNGSDNLGLNSPPSLFLLPQVHR